MAILVKELAFPIRMVVGYHILNKFLIFFSKNLGGAKILYKLFFGRLVILRFSEKSSYPPALIKNGRPISTWRWYAVIDMSKTRIFRERVPLPRQTSLKMPTKPNRISSITKVNQIDSPKNANNWKIWYFWHLFPCKKRPKRHLEESAKIIKNILHFPLHTHRIHKIPQNS